MTRRDDGMVDVELAADPEADEPGAREPSSRRAGRDASGAAAPRRGQPGDGTRGPTVPRTSRRWARAVVAGLAGVLLTAMAAQAVSEAAADRHDQALVAAHRTVSGVAPSLREPPTELWRPSEGAAVAGDIVVAQEKIDGLARTVGHDGRTGAVLWVTPTSLDPTGVGVACSSTVRRRAVVLCWVPGGGGQTAPNTDAVLGRRPERLVVLDAADGTIRQERTIDSRVIGWTVLDDDLVLAWREDQTVHVERSTLDGGARVWAAQVTLPTRVLARDMGVRTSDGLVTLTGPAAAVLDGRDGSVLATASVAPGSGVPVQVTTTPAGFAIWASRDSGTWYDRDGTPGAHLPGGPIRTPIDDGTSPTLLLLQDRATLRAVDVLTGDVLWQRPRVVGVLLRVGGLVTVEDADAVRTLDLMTGQERWSVARGLGSAAPGSTPVTDGVRVLLPGYDVEQGRRVTAYDLSDGTPRWTVPLPWRVSALAVSGGVLVGTGDQMVVFG